MLQILLFALFQAVGIAVYAGNAFAATALDPTLMQAKDEEVSNVFRDMGVVQKRAMRKSERFLFSTFASLDFSDGPYTNYSLNLNPGYAISDYFEVYANIVPLYVIQQRSIVDRVAQLPPLATGQRPSITAARPKFQYGVEVLWAPLYGKDSLGLTRIIRSDTFFKLGISQIKYDIGTGMSFRLGVGKTFFVGKSFGIRATVDYGNIETIVNSVKSRTGMLLTEAGVVFYL